jgi:chemotaxis protein CheX
MSDAVREMAQVSCDDLAAITRQVWSSFLGLELADVPVEAAVLAGPVMSAVVRISGAWEGAVRVQCSPPHAAAAAAQMFSIDASAASAADASDVLGELANVVTGNVKSLLPAPSALSMPAVTSALGSETGAISGTVLVRRVAFVATPGVLHVSVWEADDR